MIRIAVLIAMMSAPLAAADRVSDMYGKQVDILENDLVRLVEAMPADKFDFRPTQGAFAGVRTFGEQVKHTATMIYMTAAIVLEERSPYFGSQTRVEVAAGVTYHSYNHYGQMVVYARMNGVVPPASQR